MGKDRLKLKELIDNNRTPYLEKIELISPTLQAFCKDRIFNKQDAIDIAQNAILILITAKSKYDFNKSFHGWAFAICRFQIKKYLTNKKRNREDNYAPDSFAHSLNLVESKFHFDPELSEKLHIQKIQILHDIKDQKMTQKERDFFELSWSGKSREYIMKNLKLTKVNYYRLKSRVKNKLKANVRKKNK